MRVPTPAARYMQMPRARSSWVMQLCVQKSTGLIICGQRTQRRHAAERTVHTAFMAPHP